MVRRWWRIGLVVVAFVASAAAATIAGVALNVATGGSSPWLPAVQAHPLWWTVAGSLASAGTGVSGWWVQRLADRGLARLVPAERRPESWVVDRPDEVGRVVTALCVRRRSTVGITTAVQGAGGFGKTTVARLVGADRRVLHRFGGRVYWVVLGRDVRARAAIADKVNDLIAQLDPERAVTFTDPSQAGQHLAALLAAGPRRLLILDDVWYAEQEAAFPVGGRCARLVTTRVPSLVAGQCVPIRVDQVSPEQARTLLTAGLPPLPDGVLSALVAETGRWPLLVRLVNKLLVDQLATDLNVTAVASGVLERLRRSGGLHIDELTGASVQRLDVNDPQQRQEAVATTIEASTGLLAPHQRARFAELAIFAEDETIPVTLIHRLWHATGGLDLVATRILCARLHDLALLTATATDQGGVVGIHDVVRDFLHHGLGAVRVVELHRTLLDSVAAELPRAVSLIPDSPADASATPLVATAWWELDESARYLWDHLIEHLLAADRAADAELVAGDLRWVTARLEQFGPVAPYTDLALINTPHATQARQLLGQAAHLLAPTEPRHSVVDILYSRVGHDPRWGGPAQTLTKSRPVPGFSYCWPLPDRAHPALRRIYTNHARASCNVAIAPDGSWLASSSDGTLRIWDTTTGTTRATYRSYQNEIRSLAVASDGTWLAWGSHDGAVRIWDVTTGTLHAVLEGHRRAVEVVAVAPDDTWLASADYAGTVRIWDVATKAQRAVLRGHTDAVDMMMVVAPDSTWLASADSDGAVRIWDIATNSQRAVLEADDIDAVGVSALAVAPDGRWLAVGYRSGRVRIWDVATVTLCGVLTGHTDSVMALVVAPDGSWLVSCGADGTLRIWDIASRTERFVLGGSTRMRAVAVAPDGAWLAYGDGSAVRVCDAATGTQLAVLTGHIGWIDVVAVAPDGSWLASGGYDGNIRIWDAAISTGRGTAGHPVLEGHVGAAWSVAVGPDSTWLATGGRDGAIRIWDLATTAERAVLQGQAGSAEVVAIAPDGSWLVSGYHDGTVQIWDPTAKTEPTIFAGHSGPVWSVAVAPDGSWVASAGDDGTVRICDPGPGTQRAILEGHSASVRAVAVAPDGAWLASVSADGTVRIWDVAAKTERTVFVTNTGPLFAVAVAPDGTWLTCAGYGAVRIWDLATGTERCVLDGHTGPVWSVAIAPDGARLASAGNDRTVQIYDARTGKRQAMMRIEETAYACAWAPNGRSLAVGGARERPYVFGFRP